MAIVDSVQHYFVVVELEMEGVEHELAVEFVLLLDLVFVGVEGSTEPY